MCKKKLTVSVLFCITFALSPAPASAVPASDQHWHPMRPLAQSAWWHHLTSKGYLKWNVQLHMSMTFMWHLLAHLHRKTMQTFWGNHVLHQFCFKNPFSPHSSELLTHRSWSASRTSPPSATPGAAATGPASRRRNSSPSNQRVMTSWF